MPINITTNDFNSNNAIKNTSYSDGKEQMAEQGSKESNDENSNDNSDSDVETTGVSAKPADKQEIDEFAYLDVEPEDEDEDDSEDNEDEDEDESEEDTAKPKKNGFKKRIDNLTKHKKQLEAKNLELSNRLLALEQKQDQKTGNAENTPAKKEETLVEPNLDDFDTHTDYVKALTKYEFKLAKQEQEEKEYEKAFEAELKKVKASWVKKEEQARKRYPDYDKVANTLTKPLSNGVRVALNESDIGADIGYYLLKNPEKLAEINSMPLWSQSRALSKIESSLESRLKKPKVKSDEAEEKKIPEPINPIRNSSASSKLGKSPGNMSLSEYRVWFDKKYNNK